MAVKSGAQSSDQKSKRLHKIAIAITRRTGRSVRSRTALILAASTDGRIRSIAQEQLRLEATAEIATEAAICRLRCHRVIFCETPKARLCIESPTFKVRHPEQRGRSSPGSRKEEKVGRDQKEILWQSVKSPQPIEGRVSCQFPSLQEFQCQESRT